MAKLTCCDIGVQKYVRIRISPKLIFGLLAVMLACLFDFFYTNAIRLIVVATAAAADLAIMLVYRVN